MSVAVHISLSHKPCQSKTEITTIPTTTPPAILHHPSKPHRPPQPHPQNPRNKFSPPSSQPGSRIRARHVRSELPAIARTRTLRATSALSHDARRAPAERPPSRPAPGARSGSVCFVYRSTPVCVYITIHPKKRYIPNPKKIDEEVCTGTARKTTLLRRPSWGRACVRACERERECVCVRTAQPDLNYVRLL